MAWWQLAQLQDEREDTMAMLLLLKLHVRRFMAAKQMRLSYPRIDMGHMNNVLESMEAAASSIGSEMASEVSAIKLEIMKSEGRHRSSR